MSKNKLPRSTLKLLRHPFKLSFVALIVTALVASLFTATPISAQESASSDATLSEITLSDGTLSPTFDTAKDTYRASVANSVNTLDVTPDTSSDNANAEVTATDPEDNDLTVTETAGVSTVSDLVVGANTITITVTAEDDTTTKTYTLTVTRAAASSDATLSGIKLSAGTLNPTFAPTTTSYPTTVANSVATLTVTPTATHSAATIAYAVDEVDIGPITSGSASSRIDLTQNIRTRIAIKVTAEDKTTRTYYISVERAAVSSDATLSGIDLSDGTLVPVFDTAKDTYRASVANSVNTLDVTPDISNDNATVAVTATDPEDNDLTVTETAGASTISGLGVGENIVTIRVTAEDDTTTQDYTLTVTRAAAPLSSDSTLSGIKLSAGTLNPTFAPTTTSYPTTVANSVATLTVTPTATHSAATIAYAVDEVDIGPITSGSASSRIDLTQNIRTRIAIKVTAEDKTTRTYYISVERAAVSSDATLSGIDLSEGTLSPNFATATTAYTASVANSVNTLDVTPDTSSDNANAEVTATDPEDNDLTVTETAGVSTVSDLVVGANTITITVTAEDDTTTKTYTLTVTRAAASSDATLSGIKLSAGTLNPTFAPTTTSYPTTVANSVATLTVTPTATHSAATIAYAVDEVDIGPITSGSASSRIDLTQNIRTRIAIKVTAEDKTTRTYYISVERAAASSDATLSGIDLSDGTLVPVFDTAKDTYRASVANSVNTLDVTPDISNDNATVAVTATDPEDNDLTVTETAGASTISGLGVGENIVTITVTAEDDTTTKTYTLTVTRAAASSDATLSGIKLSAGTLNPTFAPTRTSYPTTVANSVATLTVTPTATHSAATIAYAVDEVDIGPITSGSASSRIDLTQNIRTRIAIKVTAEDKTTRTYYISVERAAASSDATLSGIDLSDGTLTPAFNSVTTTYISSVDNSVATLTVGSTVADSGATAVTISGGTTYASDDNIPLTEGGDTIITITVTAEDDTTTKTYYISVERAAASSDATLSGIGQDNAATLRLYDINTISSIGYIVTVPTSAENISLAPVVSHPAATLVIASGGTIYMRGQDIPLTGGATYIRGQDVLLTEGGDTIITITVTAQDGNTTKTYTVIVIPSDATLSGIALSDGTLSPAFSSGHHSYRVNVANSVASLTVTPTATNSAATITVAKEDVDSGTASSEISLTDDGTTKIIIRVTTQNNSFPTRYTILVKREAASSDATLSDIEPHFGDSVSLSPDFALNVTTYMSNAGTDDVLRLYWNTNNAFATATVTATDPGGDPLTVTRNSNTFSTIRGLGVGENIVTIRVTAQDGTTTQDYVITVTRAVSSDATLSDIEPHFGDSVSLSPDFSPDVTTYMSNAGTYGGLDLFWNTNDYRATVTVTATDPDGAELTVTRNGNTFSTIRGLGVGENIVTIRVTAEDGTTTQDYVITVTRAASSDATLSDIRPYFGSNFSVVSLSPRFNSARTTYMSNAGTNDSLSLFLGITNAFATATVTATDPGGDTLTVTRNGNTSSIIRGLGVGENIVTIRVTAEDGTTTQDYTITVTRTGLSSDATLSDIRPRFDSNFSVVSLSPRFNSARTTYMSNAGTNDSLSLFLGITNAFATATVTATDPGGDTLTVTRISNASSIIRGLGVGENIVTITVTAEDGTTTQDYVITVTRAGSTREPRSDATLSDIRPRIFDSYYNVVSISPDFAPARTTYMSNAGTNDVLRLYWNTSNANATVTVTATDPGGDPLTVIRNSNTSSRISGLGVGENIVTIRVTAVDGTTTQTYTITATRAGLNSNATLSFIRPYFGSNFSVVSLSPDFAPDVTTYMSNAGTDDALRLYWYNNGANATVTVTATDPGGDTLTVTRNSNTSSRISGLLVGENIVTIRVTAEDGTTTQDYVITVTRAASSDATLSGITLSEGTLSQPFAPTTTSYSTTVAGSVASLTVTPTATHSAATIAVNGSPVNSGSASSPIDLTEGGDTTINIVVTAQDGSTTQDYTITVTRPFRSDPTLSDIELSNDAALNPDFDSGQLTYTTTVDNSIASLTVTPTVSDDDATVTVDGTPVNSGEASSEISLTEGDDTTINIVVTAQDGSTTQDYTITVTRAAAASSDATLSGIELSRVKQLITLVGILDQPFARTTTSYSTTVANSVIALTVTPTATHSAATIAVNGEDVDSGTASTEIALTEGGTTTITITVTAEDGSTQDYTITVTRES